MLFGLVCYPFVLIYQLAFNAAGHRKYQSDCELQLPLQIPWKAVAKGDRLAPTEHPPTLFPSWLILLMLVGQGSGL